MLQKIVDDVRLINISRRVISHAFKGMLLTHLCSTIRAILPSRLQ